jgi:Protein of unknown function (DUF3551)
MAHRYFLHNVSELERRRSEEGGRLQFWLAVAIVFGTLILAFLLPTPSQAQDYAWCMSRDNDVLCYYATREQCMAVASGLGGGGCVQNPEILVRSPPRDAYAKLR